MTVKKPATC